MIVLLAVTTIAVTEAALATVLVAIAAMYARKARDAYREIRQPRAKPCDLCRRTGFASHLGLCDDGILRGVMTNGELAGIKARFKAHYPDRPVQ